jgi:hypothetical protein
MAEAALRLGVAGSSVGSVTFRLPDLGQVYSLRLESGALVCSPGMADDVVLQVTLAESAFTLLFVRAAEREAEGPLEPERYLLALRALGIDQDRAELMRQTAGTVALEIQELEQRHRVLLTPGRASPDFDHPTCRVAVDYQDFSDMQTGKAVPLQLLFAGKILIEGNAQGLMVLSSLLA